MLQDGNQVLRELLVHPQPASSLQRQGSLCKPWPCSAEGFAAWMACIGIPSFISTASPQPCKKRALQAHSDCFLPSSKACVLSQGLNYPVLFSGK